MGFGLTPQNEIGTGVVVSASGEAIDAKAHRLPAKPPVLGNEDQNRDPDIRHVRGSLLELVPACFCARASGLIPRI